MLISCSISCGRRRRRRSRAAVSAFEYRYYGCSLRCVIQREIGANRWDMAVFGGSGGIARFFTLEHSYEGFQKRPHPPPPLYIQICILKFEILQRFTM